MSSTEEPVLQTPPSSPRIDGRAEIDTGFLRSDDDELSDSFEEREFRDAQAQLFFIFPELQESLEHSNTTPQRNHPGARMERQTGVLWKRRDVFKNRWRPRWFALNPGQGVLTYYLLTTPAAAADGPVLADAVTPQRGSSRDRTTSWDSAISAVSENTVDYDVVPRGTIYLLGCTVAINDALSRPNGNLFAFTIRPPVHTEPNIHLAARTAEARDVWVERIDRVCRVGSPREMVNSTALETQRQPTLVSATPLTQRTPLTHQRPREQSTPSMLPSTARGLQRQPLRERILEEGSSPLRPTASIFSGIQDEQQDTWSALGSPETTYAGVPESLASRIRQTLESYLHQCDDCDAESNDWKQLFSHEGTEHCAYQRVDGQGRTTIKSVALLDHPPKQIFSLLIDISRRKDYETNVRSDERMKEVNPHTFYDYYAYNAVRTWQRSCREQGVGNSW
jgi:PH domain